MAAGFSFADLAKKRLNDRNRKKSQIQMVLNKRKAQAAKSIPPGLAKKPGGLPPGQFKRQLSAATPESTPAGWGTKGKSNGWARRGNLVPGSQTWGHKLPNTTPSIPKTAGPLPSRTVGNKKFL